MQKNYVYNVNNVLMCIFKLEQLTQDPGLGNTTITQLARSAPYYCAGRATMVGKCGETFNQTAFSLVS